MPSSFFSHISDLFYIFCLYSIPSHLFLLLFCSTSSPSLFLPFPFSFNHSVNIKPLPSPPIYASFSQTITFPLSHPPIFLSNSSSPISLFFLLSSALHPFLPFLHAAYLPLPPHPLASFSLVVYGSPSPYYIPLSLSVPLPIFLYKFLRARSISQTAL